MLRRGTAGCRAVRCRAAGAGPAGRPDVAETLRVAQAEFVHDLPWGLDTRIGEQGLSLSGCQPQRLALARAVLQALLDGAPAGASCVGVGVAVCGVVSAADGTVRFAPNLGWSDVALTPMLASRIGLKVPVRLGNDAELGALAEQVVAGETDPYRAADQLIAQL